MAKPTSDIHICNLALDRLGIRSITSIDTPVTPEEDVCARHYDAARREALRTHVWNFAKKYDTLTASGSVTPDFGFSVAYALPNDFIRLCTLGDTTLGANLSSDLYDLSEGYIFTDSAGDDGLAMQYIHDAVTVAKFDALFVRVLVLTLAHNMSYKFNLKASVRREIQDEMSELTTEARAVDGQEKPPQRVQRSAILNARRMGLKRNNKYT